MLSVVACVFARLERAKLFDAARCSFAERLAATSDAVVAALADPSIPAATTLALQNCHCDSLGARSLLSSLCPSSSFSDNSQLASLFAIATILIINASLRRVAPALALMQRHSSQAQEQVACASLLFLGLFANSSLVLLAVHADKHGPGSDWFAAVGASLLLVMTLPALFAAFDGLRVRRVPIRRPAASSAREQRRAGLQAAVHHADLLHVASISLVMPPRAHARPHAAHTHSLTHAHTSPATRQLGVCRRPACSRASRMSAPVGHPAAASEQRCLHRRRRLHINDAPACAPQGLASCRALHLVPGHCPVVALAVQCLVLHVPRALAAHT